MKEQNTYQVPKSPLLERAKCFIDILKKDNDRIQEFLNNGGNPEEISVEKINDNEENIIEMTLLKGIFENHFDTPQIFDEIEISPEEFQKESKKE